MLVEALINTITGTYYDKSRNEYFLVLGGRIVGGYKPTGDKERDSIIDRMMWKGVLESAMKG